MWFGIVSIFPGMFDVIKKYGVTSYAWKKKLLSLNFFNPKNYSSKKNIYNKPYGGGKGVVMCFPPLKNAINAARSESKNALIVYVSPKGKLVDNNIISKLSQYESLIFLSGRYEEVDYRIIKSDIDIELSIGDYIISGGELSIMIIIDAICRLLPNVIRNKLSINIESFNDRLLDYRQYTKPNKSMGFTVPRILLSGDHGKISTWRYKQRLGYTFLRRPDLLFDKKLSLTDKHLLNEFILRK